MSAQRLIPPLMWKEMEEFMAAGKTGKVEVIVRGGRITHFTVLASFTVPGCESPPRIVELNDPLRRQVQCER